jgi:hypothetical protein
MASGARVPANADTRRSPMSTPLGSNRAGFLCLLTVLTAGLLSSSACTSKELDPRINLDAPYEHQAPIAQFINGSNLWEAYLDYLSPDGSTLVVEIHLGFEREITRKSTGGDYDPGVVHAKLQMKNLVSGKDILLNHDKFAIKDFVFVGDENATREEVQAAAFASTEETAMRFVFRLLELGVVYGMRDEGPAGVAFVPSLEETAEDPWAGDMAGAAKQALRAIRGT